MSMPARSRHIGRHIPGNPNVIVQNPPGAGSLSAVRNLDATLSRDGTLTVVVQSRPGDAIDRAAGDGQGRLPQRLVGGQARRRLPGLLRLWAEGRERLWGRHDEPQRVHPRLDRQRRRQLHQRRHAAPGVNAPVRQILASPAAREQRIAIERGELDGDCGGLCLDSGCGSTRRRCTLRALLAKRGEEIPESAVYIATFAKTDEQRALERAQRRRRDRPADHHVENKSRRSRLAIMRQAFKATLRTRLPRRHEKLGHRCKPLPRRQGGGSDRRQDVGVPREVLKQARAIDE